MNQPATSINLKLIDSLAQIIFSLTEEERQILVQKIQHSASDEEIKCQKEVLQNALNLGIEQLNNGNYMDYDDLSLPSLLETIKVRGKHKLQQELIQ